MCNNAFSDCSFFVISSEFSPSVSMLLLNKKRAKIEKAMRLQIRVYFLDCIAVILSQNSDSKFQFIEIMNRSLAFLVLD